MKSFVLSLALGVAMSVASFAPAAAQNAPGGSYLQTCSHAHTNGNTLMAECRNTGGGYQRSSLPLPCRGDIQNNNGMLACGGGNWHGGGGGGGYYGGLPGGSYQSSCRNARMMNGTLVASCQSTNGSYNQTSLNAGRCRPGTDVANVNGQLVCLSYR